MEGVNRPGGVYRMSSACDGFQRGVGFVVLVAHCEGDYEDNEDGYQGGVGKVGMVVVMDVGVDVDVGEMDTEHAVVVTEPAIVVEAGFVVVVVVGFVKMEVQGVSKVVSRCSEERGSEGPWTEKRM